MSDFCGAREATDYKRSWLIGALGLIGCSIGALIKSTNVDGSSRRLVIEAMFVL
jgi:hypothetical protein